MNLLENELYDETFDPIELRKVFSQFATGVAIVTTCGDEGAPVGLTINSFSSLSLEPPQIMWSLSRSAPSIGAFKRHSSFAVNIMGSKSKDIVLNFARPSNNKFKFIKWHNGLERVPLLDEATAYIECETIEIINGGDHEVFVGRVKNFKYTASRPIIFHSGQFHELGPEV